MRSCVMGFGLAVLAGLSPSYGYAMDRAAMDQVLAMAKSRPDAPEFREALVKRLGEAPIKAGEAFDSNGPDLVWAVEAAAQPTLVDPRIDQYGRGKMWHRLVPCLPTGHTDRSAIFARIGAGTAKLPTFQ